MMNPLAYLTLLVHLQKQQQAKETEALLATAPAVSPAAAETGASIPAATDNQKTNLVHAWVMVLSGKREVCAISSGCHVQVTKLLQRGCAATHQLNATFIVIVDM